MRSLLLGIADGPLIEVKRNMLLEWLTGSPSESLLVGGSLIARDPLPVW